MSWENSVPCSGDPEAWFGYDAEGGSRNPDQERVIERAKLLCAEECPLAARRQCARAALDGREVYGIWAGVELILHKTSSRQRRKKLAAAREELATIADGVLVGVVAC